MIPHKITQSERLFYIEFLAVFVGRVSRKDLLDRFGISEAAATKDISLYTDLAPNVLSYDIKKKVYTFSSDKNTLYEHDVDQSLFSLSGERAIAINVEHAKRLPSWNNLSIKKTPSLELVSTLTRCIYQNLKASVKYHSLSSGGTNKVLTPLAILNDGARWHIRSYDHKKNEFRTYSLERFAKVKEIDKSDISLTDDHKWNNHVMIRLGANPDAKHPESILMDYEVNVDGFVEISLRECTVGFFLRRWQIDCTDNFKNNSDSQQLVLLNTKELEKAGLNKWDLGC